jgi:hypothetical protein
VIMTFKQSNARCSKQTKNLALELYDIAARKAEPGHGDPVL